MVVRRIRKGEPGPEVLDGVTEAQMVDTMKRLLREKFELGPNGDVNSIPGLIAAFAAQMPPDPMKVVVVDGVLKERA
jgi:hypothetical protein